MVSSVSGAAGAIILSISYGYDVSGNGPDPLVQLSETTLEEGSKAATPGSFLVIFYLGIRFIQLTIT